MTSSPTSTSGCRRRRRRRAGAAERPIVGRTDKGIAIIEGTSLPETTLDVRPPSDATRTLRALVVRVMAGAICAFAAYGALTHLVPQPVLAFMLESPPARYIASHWCESSIYCTMGPIERGGMLVQLSSRLVFYWQSNRGYVVGNLFLVAFLGLATILALISTLRWRTKFRTAAQPGAAGRPIVGRTEEPSMRLNRTHVLHWAVILVILAPWVLTTPAVLKETLGTLRLRGGTGVAIGEGQVTAIRRRGDRGGVEVRYTFSVDGSGSRYTASEAGGGTNLWIHLTSAAGARARETGGITVKYLTHDPMVNRPVEQAGEPLLDMFTCAILAVLGWIVLLGGAYLLWRNARLCQQGIASSRRLGPWFWTAPSDMGARGPAAQPGAAGGDRNAGGG